MPLSKSFLILLTLCMLSCEGQPFSGIIFILEDKQHNIWFGGRKGLWKFDGETVLGITTA